MKITLRKANAIQIEINNVLKGLEFKTEIGINEFQKPEEEIKAASALFFTNVNRRNALLQTLFEIRKLTAKANSTNGIDAHLANLAFLEKEVSFFTAYSKIKERLSTEVLVGKLDKIATRNEDSYYNKAEVETSVFTATELKALRELANKAKKEKQHLQDELLELNVRTTIELSDASVETLRSEDII